MVLTTDGDAFWDSRQIGGRSQWQNEEISTAAEEDAGSSALEHGADGAGPRRPHHADGAWSRLANPRPVTRASS